MGLGLTGSIDARRLHDALAETRAAIDTAAARAGRAPGSVEVVVAGKYVAPEDAPALVAAGIAVVGENRAQDLAAKAAVVGDALTFDFIGHLQRRKVRDVIGRVRLVHSLDSAALACEISRRTAGTVRALVELNLSNEQTKHGIAPTMLQPFLEEVAALPALEVVGLMVMPPATADPETSRPHFAALRALAERAAGAWEGRFAIRELSMGTTQDHLVAVEEGATIVRLGRGLLQTAKAG